MPRTIAKDIMTTELIVGRETMTVEDAIKLLVNNRITGFPIVDKERKLVGVVSEFDIIKAVDEAKDTNVVDLASTIHYSRKVRTITEDTPWAQIIRTFVEKKVRRLPVVDGEGRLTGIITRRDIMRTLFYRAKSNNK